VARRQKQVQHVSDDALVKQWQKDDIAGARATATKFGVMTSRSRKARIDAANAFNTARADVKGKADRAHKTKQALGHVNASSKNKRSTNGPVGSARKLTTVKPTGKNKKKAVATRGPGGSTSFKTSLGVG